MIGLTGFTSWTKRLKRSRAGAWRGGWNGTFTPHQSIDAAGAALGGKTELCCLKETRSETAAQAGEKGTLDVRNRPKSKRNQVCEGENGHQERGATHRPRELEGDGNPAGLVQLVGIVLGALQRKGIPTENVRRSLSKGAGASVVHLRLVLLQTDFKVGVARVAGAAQVRGVPGAVAALPVRQLAVYILHGDHL